MTEIRPEITPATFVTLGPEGTDHERVTQRFIKFQGLEEIAKVELVEDIIGEGPERVLAGDNNFLVLCAAHPEFHIVNERYSRELVAVGSTVDATRDMSIVVRSDVEQPRNLALVKATHGYVDLESWREKGAEIIDAQSKPVITQMLIDGECDAGLTFTYVATDNPGFHIEENIGEIATVWGIFGRKNNNNPFQGSLIGIKQPELFTGGNMAT